MQKKKLIIIIVAAVVAAALVITGIVLALKSAFSGGTDNDISSGSAITGSDNVDSSDLDTQSGNKTDDSSSKDSSGGKTSSSGKAEINVGSVSGKKGQTVRVPVTIDSNPGIMAMLLEFKYDSDVLKYTGYSEGNVLSDYEFVDKDGTLTFLAVESKDIKDNGDLFYIEFEILSDKAQDSEVKIVVGDDSISNYDEEFVKVSGANGKVTIK